MTHRKWTPGALMAKAYRDITEEHNATVDAWQQAAADVERLAKANGDLCDEIAKLCVGGLRSSVPFGTDETPEQIEIRRLKQEAHYDHTAAAERIAELERELAGLRGGIRVPFSDAQVEKMAKAARRECEWQYVDQSSDVLKRWQSIIRAALAAGGLESCAVPVSIERTSDEELAKIGRAAGVWKQEWDELPDGNKKWWTACAAAVRARVEAPLLAEIERLKKSCTMHHDRKHDVLAELEAVKAERDRYHAERDDASQEQDNLIYQRNDFRHWHANEQKKVADLSAELAALRQRVPVDPTPEQVEALARVLDTAYETEAGGHTPWRDQSPCHQDRRCAQARAAFANIGARRDECQECAKKEAEIRRHSDKWTGFIQRCQADAAHARAALEGE